MTIALSELPNISEVGKVEEEGSELAGVPLANTLALSLLRTLGLPWVKEDTNMGSIRTHLNSQLSHGKLGGNGKMPSKYRGKNNFQLRIPTLPSYQVRVEKNIFRHAKFQKNVTSSALLGHKRRICFTKTRGYTRREEE